MRRLIENLESSPESLFAAAVAMLVWALVAFGETAPTAPPSAVSSPLPAAEYSKAKSDYLRKTEAELDAWDKSLARWQKDPKLSPHSDRYKALDDLEMQIKEVRGDLLKAKEISQENWRHLKNRIDGKMENLRDNFRKTRGNEKA